MCQNCLVKTIHHAQHHFGWDNSLSPVLHVASGSQLEFHCLDAANGWGQPGFSARGPYRLTAGSTPVLPQRISQRCRLISSTRSVARSMWKALSRAMR